MNRLRKALVTGILGGGAALAYYQRVMATTPIAYWALDDASGTTAVDKMGLGNGSLGAGAAAPTLGATGIGDGKTAYSFDEGDHVNIYSAALNTAFTPAECSMMIWAQVSGAGIWTDGAAHFAMQLRADVNNRIAITKQTTNTNVQAIYAAGGTAKTIGVATASPTTWMCLGVSVSKSSDAMKFFLNGAQIGTTQTGLGTWSGALNSAVCVIGGASTAAPTTPWSGSLAHAAVWSKVLTPSDFLALANPL